MIDDDEDIREALRDVLTEDGYRVDLAENGKDALAFMRRRGRPDLVLLDLMMPVMNGWDFRRYQLSDPSLADVPVICLTAVFDPARVAEDLRVRCFRKPVALDDVLNEVAAVCG